MPSLILHEPAPSHPQVMGFGRGGAGNRTHAPPPPPPTSLPTTTSTSSSSQQSTPSTSSRSGAYMTGRGGAGNAHPRTEERRLFSFDEELALQNRVAPVFHIGRGGQGNLIIGGGGGGAAADEVVREEARRSSDSRSSRGSTSSSAGGSEGSVRRAGPSSGMGWIKGLARRS